MSEVGWRKWIRNNVRVANPFLWVLEGRLACAPRPLHYHPQFGGRVPSLPPDAAGALTNWLLAIRDAGVGTITCPATLGEIRRYAALVGSHGDLLVLYRSTGFVVHHHPIEYPAHASVRGSGRDSRAD